MLPDSMYWHTVQTCRALPCKMQLLYQLQAGLQVDAAVRGQFLQQFESC